MNRSFVINVVIAILSNVLIKPLYIFGIDREVQLRLPEGQYGLFTVLLNLMFILQISNDLGLQQYINTQTAREPNRFHILFPRAVIAKGLLSVFYALVVCLLAAIMGYWEHPGLLLGVLSIQLLSSAVLFARAAISGLGHYRIDSLLSVFDRFLLILVCGFLLYGGLVQQAFQLRWFILAQCATLAVTLVACLLVIHKRKIQTLQWQYPGHGEIINIIRKGLPYALVVVLMSVYTYMDSIMLEKLLPQQIASSSGQPVSLGLLQVDNYAAAFRLFTAANMLGFVFAGLLLPMYSRLLSEGKSVAELVKISFLLLWGLSLAIAIPVCVFSADVIQVLYYPKYDVAALTPILTWLMLAFVANGGMYIFSSVLVADQKLHLVNKTALLGVCINALLNALLIPRYMAQGAAFASFVTQAVVTALYFFQVQRQHHPPFSLSDYLRIGLYPLVIIGLSVLVYAVLGSGYDSVSGWPASILPTPAVLPAGQGVWWLAIRLGLAGGFSVLAFWAMGFVSVKKMLTLLKNRK